MNTDDQLTAHCQRLRLPYLRDHAIELAGEAARKSHSHLDFLAELIAGQVAQTEARAIERRIGLARFPTIKTLDTFDWTHPTIDRAHVQSIFQLRFIADPPSNVVFLGGCGLGKTHLATALGHQACIRGHRVLFATAISIVNHLSAAVASNTLAKAMARYTKPSVLVIDELGYLPIKREGADLLFQVISARYERGAIILTTNRAFKDWGKTFDNDAVLASALLDRLLHRCEVVVIKPGENGRSSYRDPHLD
jgi:DNA replication protein DnaC